MQNIYIELLFADAFFLKFTPEQDHRFDVFIETSGTQEIRENDRCLLCTDELVYLSEVIAVRGTKLLVVDNTEIV